MEDLFSHREFIKTFGSARNIVPDVEAISEMTHGYDLLGTDSQRQEA